MADEQLISSFVDEQAFKAQGEFVSGVIKGLYDQYIQLKDIKISLTPDSSFQQSIKAQTDLKKIMDDIAVAQQKLIDLENKSSDAKGTNKIKTEAQIKATLDVRNANQSLTKEIIAQTDAYKALDLAFQKASGNAKTLQAKAIQTGNPADQAAANTASQEAKRLNDQLKSIDSSVGEARRNVGDYTGALKVLEQQLAAVNTKLAAMAAAGQQGTTEFINLNKEQGLLSTIVSNYSGAMSSATTVTRANERALQTLTAAGYGNTEMFDQLRGKVIESSQSFKEFARQEKLLESEAPLLGAVTLAAKALGGAYAIGAGAAALFADGNEKVQKEINKLVAIMTILTGLEEAYRLIQEAGAITMAFRKAQTTLLTAATEAYTIATGGAVIATESLEAALIASGIGAIIVAVAVAAGYLISKLVELGTADERAIKQQKELAEITKELNVTLQKEIDLIGRVNQDEIDLLKRQLAGASALGITKEQELALKQKIADLDADQAKQAFDAASRTALAQQQQIQLQELNAGRKRDLVVLNNQLVKGEISITDFLAKKEAINSRISDKQLTQENALAAARDQHLKDYDTDLKKLNDLQDAKLRNIAEGNSIPSSLKNRIEAQTALVEKDKQAADQEEAILNKRNETAETKEVVHNDILKLGQDDRRKLVLATAKLEADLTTSNNEIILNDERSTLSQRLSALKSNAEQERKVIEAEKKNILNDPTVSGTDKIIAVKSAAEQELKIDAETKEKIYKESYAFAQRDKAARLQTSTEILNQQLKNDQEILNQDKAQQEESLKDFSGYLAKRNGALVDSYNVRRAIIQGNQINEISNAGENRKTAAEILDINVKFEEQLADLDRTYGKEITDEQKHQLDLRLGNIQRNYEDQKRIIDEHASSQIIGIGNQFQAGKISSQAYNAEKEKIEFESQKKILEEQIKADFKAQESTKEGSEERKKANADFAQHSLQLSELVSKDEESDEQKKQKRNQDELQAAEATAETLKSFEDDRFQNELNHIQKLIDKNKEYGDKQLANIKSATLSTYQKSELEQTLAKKTNDQNEILVKRQRDLKRKEAEFDKAFAIAQIIEQTAIAVVAALKIPVYGEIEAIAIGIIGAANLAKVIATPIPSYKQGRKGGPGEWALTDEAGPELYKKSSGEYYIGDTKPNVKFIEQGTDIIPHDKLKDMLMSNLLVNADGKLRMAGDSMGVRNDQMEGKINELNDTMKWVASEVTGAITNQKTKIIINNHINGNWNSYIDTKVYK